MKYIDLANQINRLTDEQKQTDVSVYLMHQDERIPLKALEIDNSQSVLDAGRPILILDF